MHAWSNFPRQKCLGLCLWCRKIDAIEVSYCCPWRFYIWHLRTKMSIHVYPKYHARAQKFKQKSLLINTQAISFTLHPVPCASPFHSPQAPHCVSNLLPPPTVVHLPNKAKAHPRTKPPPFRAKSYAATDRTLSS